MRTKYIANPDTPGTVLHNGSEWQVTDYMGGLCCELLRKIRLIDREDQRGYRLSEHACYPSLLFQGEEADAFRAELENAQNKLSASELNSLFFSAYEGVVRCPEYCQL